MTCKNCERELVADELALNRKLISRAAVTFLCADCLAEHFKVDRKVIDDRVKFFRANGCGLFK
ncbi:hypothetical protein FACS1894202_04580 [Clostridia bacterium]|nr:hypothetical protein FACS1894202_04580 [Clostridia bacterium]